MRTGTSKPPLNYECQSALLNYEQTAYVTVLAEHPTGSASTVLARDSKRQSQPHARRP